MTRRTHDIYSLKKVYHIAGKILKYGVATIHPPLPFLHHVCHGVEITLPCLLHPSRPRFQAAVYQLQVLDGVHLWLVAHIDQICIS